MTPAFHIAPARSAEDLAATARLFEAYAAALGIDLGFQDFARELAELPGKYAAPTGALLLARAPQGTPLGCVALRPLVSGAPQAGAPQGRCEMKRLYVAPSARGSGLGRALVEAILGEGARLGYREMWLDTLPTMTGALRLYREAGFTPIPPYYDTPLAGTLFLARPLSG